MKPSTFFILLIAGFVLTSCENPADKTVDAEISTSKTAATGEGTKYTFTNQSSVEFTGSKVTGKHDGGFKSFTGFFTVKEGEEVPNSGKVVIDMNSTWSDDEKLTGHLKSTDFFAVENYPESTFEITSVTKNSALEYTVAGNLTLHGITKNISFPAQVATGDNSVTVKAEFDINRKEFDINYPGRTDDLIRDEVIIRLDLEAQVE